MSIRFIKYVYFRLPTAVKLLITVFLLMTFFGTVIHLFEPSQFPTIFDGIWWAFVTGATVGYGDYIPLTPAGRIIAILLILTGGGLIAFYITSLSSATVKHEQDLESGRLPFKGSNHFIFIGWNERTKQLIHIASKNYPATRIVLIDRTLRQLTFQEYPVHFIHGDASEDAILEKANIKYAACVLITSELNKSERQADNYTILSTIAIRGNNNQIPIVAEILSKIQIENALRAGATTIIRSNEFMSGLFFHELSHAKTATPFEDIIQLLTQQQFAHLQLPSELDGKSFLHVSNQLLQQGYLTLGYIRDEKYYIHPNANHTLLGNDILISITCW